MENLLTRYRNISILVGVLFLQVLGLAIQVKRNTENESTRLIRVWTVAAVTPLEKGIVGLQNGTSNIWHNYLYLRGVRKENRDLQQEIQQLRLNQVRLSEDAEQAHRLQALLGFKEHFIARTTAAQVIGSSGSDQSRSVYIDKGEENGIRPDMPVITADGVVGKVLRVFGGVSEVMLINDQGSGAGAIVESAAPAAKDDPRLQGIIQGSPSGDLMLGKIMSDEQVQVGDKILTSGGDDIFPKGMPLGTVAAISKGKNSFLQVRVKPAADLNRLEEVLVITKQEQRVPASSDSGMSRAADILARQLPSVPDKSLQEQSAKTATPAGTAVKAQVKPQSVHSASPQSQPGPHPATAPAVSNASAPAKKAASSVVKISDQPEATSPTAPAVNPVPHSPPASASHAAGGQTQ